MTTLVFYLSILAIGVALSFRMRSRVGRTVLRLGSVLLAVAFVALALLTRHCGGGLGYGIYACDEPTVDRLAALFLPFLTFPIIALVALVVLGAMEWRARR
ncbi:hypothetical protein ACK8OR_17640 [Jannaschia sp. KMU-145]|uniref:hypothetical protein n=1 Tax=Jannaschia halovivens TaxID=3388667 RepID=UPI00396B245C